MSRFQRKGTVSKGSGPTHINSYALKGVPIRYNPPIFLPELIHLPASWKPPILPSQHSFYYDYTVERKVLEQAKNRAVSIAAEASLQMKEINRLRETNQLVESRDEDSDDSTSNSSPPMPRPPVIPGSDILTPTPVIAVDNMSRSGPSGEQMGQTTPKGAESDRVNETVTKESDNLKSLGQMSIREFEGDTSDPFEIASLQAINDMEILQTVLQPSSVPLPTTSSVAVTTHPSTAPLASSSASQLSSVAPSTSGPHSVAPKLTPSTTSSTNISSYNQPVTSGVAKPVVTSQTSTPTTTAVPSVPIQAPQRASSSPTVGAVVSGSSPSNPFLAGAFVAAPPVTIHQQAPPIVTPTPPVTSTNPFHATTPPAAASQPPTFGLPAVAIGSQLVTLPPVAPPTGIPPQPVTLAAGTPPIATDSAGIPPLQEASVGHLIDIGSGGHQATTSTPVSQTVAPSSVPPQSVPPIPKPRSAPATVLSSPATTAAGPLPSQRNPVFPTSQHVRFGMGVPVLPPIPGSSITTGSSQRLPPPASITTGATQPPPPPYKVHPSPPTQHRDDLPPPYSASGQPSPPKERPQVAAAPPPIVPRTYKLPDPTAKLSNELKSEMKSISGMGFPSPRVARTLLKCEGDRTKVFDFLFLVGKLEEQGYNGDSAETALLACDDKPEEALEYLNKVAGYKGMGFSEKAIHDAYSKSKGDWDKALDVLIQGR